MATSAGRQAVAASVLFTAAAAIDAARTVAVFAISAANKTFAAKSFFTTRAGADIVFVDRRVAIVTPDPVPLIELDVGRTDGVGVENSIDDREKVEQPPLGERSSNCAATLPGTKSCVTDVRMRRLRVGGRWVRIQGRDGVRRLLSESVQVQMNCKPPEFDLVERDRLRRNRQFAVGERNAAKFVVGRDQLVIEQP